MEKGCESQVGRHLSACEKAVACQGDTFDAMVEVRTTIITLARSPSMIHPTPTKVLLATTLQPLVVQLSGSLARGAKLIDHFLHHEPTPQQMATCERELSPLLREVGGRVPVGCG